VGASLYAERFPRGSSAPKVNSLGRAQVAEGLGHLATPRHTTLGLDPLAQHLVGLLDGSRDLDGLVAAMETGIDEGSLPVETTKGQRGRGQLRANCERLLALFARQGVLVEG
jgi:hypothetical protein